MKSCIHNQWEARGEQSAAQQVAPRWKARDLAKNTRQADPDKERRDRLEIAVDDFAPRQYAENDMISRYVRAINYMKLKVRRRSLVIPRFLAGVPVR